jgi:hypothetical protein
MQPIEASVVVPLSPEQMWDFIRNNVLRADELLPDVVALKDFQMREDGMLTSRVPELPPVSRETLPEQQRKEPQEAPQRSWWRRIFGG